MDGEGAHAVEGRGLAIDGAGGRPGGAPGELVLADLIRGQRGSPRVAAEERGEMGNPAAGGALGPELPDLVVLEVGVAEISQGRPLGAERAPRQGFFKHPEYLAVRAHLPAPWQDILDLAYYSGWRKNEILGLTWEEIDEAGGLIRLCVSNSQCSR